MKNIPANDKHSAHTEPQTKSRERSYGKPEDITVEDSGLRDRLIEIMNDKNLGQVELAKLTDYTQGGLRHVLIGKSYPNYSFVRNLLIAMPELSAEWLVRAEGAKYRNAGKLPNSVPDRIAGLSNGSENKFQQKSIEINEKLIEALAELRIERIKREAAEKLLDEKERMIGILLHRSGK
jgi:hypothetical protein